MPQESVLSPILFNIYMNNIASFLPSCDIIQYADDAQIIVSSNTDIDHSKDLRGGLENKVISMGSN